MSKKGLYRVCRRKAEDGHMDLSSREKKKMVFPHLNFTLFKNDRVQKLPKKQNAKTSKKWGRSRRAIKNNILSHIRCTAYSKVEAISTFPLSGILVA